MILGGRRPTIVSGGGFGFALFSLPFCEMDEITPYIKVFIAIFVLVNPLEGIPVYLARTQGMAAAERRAIARTTAISIAIVLWVSMAVGGLLLQLLGISVGAFTVAGGILIFLIALKMVLGPGGADLGGGSSGGDGSSFAIVPLAIPLLAGPGPISSVIVYASKGITHHGGSPRDDIVLAGIILVVAIAAFIALSVADPARRLLGDTGINVFTRVAGLLVAAIAVDMIHEGLSMLYPALLAAS